MRPTNFATNQDVSDYVQSLGVPFLGNIRVVNLDEGRAVSEMVLAPLFQFKDTKTIAYFLVPDHASAQSGNWVIRRVYKESQYDAVWSLDHNIPKPTDYFNTGHVEFVKIHGREIVVKVSYNNLLNEYPEIQLNREQPELSHHINIDTLDKTLLCYAYKFCQGEMPGAIFLDAIKEKYDLSI